MGNLGGKRIWEVMDGEGRGEVVDAQQLCGV
jgi:hypothetical protein